MQAKLEGLPVAFCITGPAVRYAELAAQASDAAITWLSCAAVGATLGGLLIYLDPIASAILFASLCITAGCVAGGLALLPVPFGGDYVPWVILSAALAPHTPALCIATLVQSGADEVTVLHHLSPPLLRAAGCNLLFLGFTAAVFPLQHVRSLATLLAMTVLLGAFHALLLVPILHAAVRHPPPRAPAAAADSGAGRFKTAASCLNGSRSAPSYHTLTI